MGVEIKGYNEMIKSIEKKLGAKRMLVITDKALVAGGKAFVSELERQMKPWSDTGATVKEITLSEPYDRSGERVISVYWKGPKNRSSIIHLNEHGTINNPSPAGKGSIARALKNSEKTYKAIVKKELEAGF